MVKIYIYNLLHKDQLHVSALDNGDLACVMWDEWCGYMGFCYYMLCLGIILCL